MLVEAFDAYTGIEALDEGVIGGFPWTAKIQNDAICIRPQVELPRGKLTAIVDLHASRFAKHGDGSVERRYDIGGLGLMSDPKRRTDPGEIIHDRQNP